MSTRSPRAHGPRRPARRRSARMWFAVLFSGVMTIVFALLFLAIVATAVSGPDHRSSTRVGEVVTGLLFLGALVLSLRAAIRAEHRWRDGESPAKGGLAKSWHSSTRSAHYGPISAAVGLLLFGSGTIAMAALAITDYSQGQRSAYVQQHGSLRNAVATGVTNSEHCGKYSCNYTAAIDLTVTPALHGVTSTVAHYNGSSDVLTGERLQVLVDPEQPGYAELPGSPFKGVHTWVISAVMALVFGLITTLWIKLIGEQRRQRRVRSGRLAAAT